MDIAVALGGQGRTTVERLTENIQQPPEAVGCRWHMQRRTAVVDRNTALQTGTAMKSYRSYMQRVKML